MFLRLIDYFVNGVLVIATAGVISTAYSFFVSKAVDAHSKGLISYKTYTDMLWDKEK